MRARLCFIVRQKSNTWETSLEGRKDKAKAVPPWTEGLHYAGHQG